MNVERSGLIKSKKIVKLFTRSTAVLLLIGVAGCEGSFFAPSAHAPDAAVNGGNFELILKTINFICLGFFAYYILVLKPRKVELDAHDKFLEGLSKNTEVVTSGGIIGRVVQKKSDIVSLEISPKITIRVLAKEVHPLVSKDKEKEAEKP